MMGFDYHDPTVLCADLRAMGSVVANNAAELIEAQGTELAEAREMLCRPGWPWHHMLCSDALCCHGDWHWPHHCTRCRWESRQAATVVLDEDDNDG